MPEWARAFTRYKYRLQLRDNAYIYSIIRDRKDQAEKESQVIIFGFLTNQHPPLAILSIQRIKTAHHLPMYS